MIEFLYDCVSKPLQGYYHSYSNCGWHYSVFDKEVGQNEFREEINDIIKDYNIGYELSKEGEILALSETGLEEITNPSPTAYDPANIDNRIKAAILKFRRYRSSQEDRRDAIRDLADVLEFLRPKLTEVLTKKDEKDLFQIANGFGIRHHNDKQKTDYERGIWYNWMFYFYLATIHTAIAVLNKSSETIVSESDNEVSF